MPPPLKKRYFPAVKELREEWFGRPSGPALYRRYLQALYSSPEGISGARLTSTSEGSIRKLMILFPRFLHEEDSLFLREAIISLLRALPPYCQLHAITHEDVKEKTRALLRSEFSHVLTIHTVPPHLDISPWIEDPFVFARTKGEDCMLTPFYFSRKQDQLISWYLEREAGIKRVTLPLIFEGGNILTGDDFILIGQDYLLETAAISCRSAIPESSLEKVEEEFRRYLGGGRKVFFIGTSIYLPEAEEEMLELNGGEWIERRFRNNEEGTVQPVFHIDMFISLAGRSGSGKYRVLVGDTAWGAEISGLTLSYAMMREAFDDIALQLTRLGFEVHRNPLPMVYLDDTEVQERLWYLASYNNCLTEISGSSRKVWLPTYGHGCWEALGKADAENERIWRSLGFEVEMLGDFNPWAYNNGSVHCLTKYISREP